MQEIKYIFTCILGTTFFAFLLNAPKRSIIPGGIIGGLGYIVYLLLLNTSNSLVLASFLGAMTVAFMGEILARIMKMPATILITAAIVPLVPGVGLYHTMLALVQDDIMRSLETGVETMLVAGAIAMAIAIVALIMRLVGSKRPKASN